MTLVQRLAGSLVSGVMHLMALLPLGVSQFLGRRMGRLILGLNTRAARVTRTNIEVCLPDLTPAQQRELLAESLEHTGQMLMETPAAWLGNPVRIGRWIRHVEGLDLVNEAIAANDGLIILLPHSGNWEMINAYMSSVGIKVTGLYHPPNQAWLQPLMSEVRGRFGNELVPTTVKGIATLYRRLNEGHIVVILPDQVPGQGEFATFFGMEALTDKLITRLLRKTRARVVNCVVKRLPRAGGFDVMFSEPHPDIYDADAAIALRGMNLSVEACALAAPEQYQWEYKRFKERPPGELRLYNYDNEPWTHH